jgi:predicted esterase
MGMPMPSWYDIIGLDSRSNEVCNGLDESMDKILELVENEVGECNGVGAVDYSRIVLAGFSQGGALALYTGMTSFRKQKNPTAADVQQKGLGLAGIVIMSGYLPRSSSFTIASGSETTPILHCHGTEDSVVAVEAAGLSKDRVSSLMEDKGGKKELYQVKTYRGLGHSVLMEELDDVSAFLNKVIPPIVR